MLTQYTPCRAVMTKVLLSLPPKQTFDDWRGSSRVVIRLPSKVYISIPPLVIYKLFCSSRVMPSEYSETKTFRLHNEPSSNMSNTYISFFYVSETYSFFPSDVPIIPLGLIKSSATRRNELLSGGI